MYYIHIVIPVIYWVKERHSCMCLPFKSVSHKERSAYSRQKTSTRLAPNQGNGHPLDQALCIKYIKQTMSMTHSYTNTSICNRQNCTKNCCSFVVVKYKSYISVRLMMGYFALAEAAVLEPATEHHLAAWFIEGHEHSLFSEPATVNLS